MKNLVFCGDGILCPQEGYGESLVELLLLRNPSASFRTFMPRDENLATDGALREAPALIGKAPDFVLLGLGHADLLRGDVPEAGLQRLRELVQLLLLKTQARIALASLCTTFLPFETRASAEAFNAGLAPLVEDARVQILDLDTPVRAFLDAHRKGGGEKRALHVHPLRPTSMGRAVLAHAAWDGLDLSRFISE